MRSFVPQFLKHTVFILFTLGTFLLSVSIAQAADLVLSPSTGSYSVGQTFTATVRSVSGGDTINAVEAELSFDPSVLSVVSVSKDGTAFSLWTTEPEFSNSAGSITFGGGNQNNLAATANLLNVTFRVLEPGDASVVFSEGSILAADGRGTDVYENGVGGTYTLTAARVPDPTPQPEPDTTPTEPVTEDESEDAIIFGDPPRPPEIGSATFLDSTVWYSDPSGVFTWTLPFDVTAVAVEIATSADNIPQDNPDAVIDPPTEEFVITPDTIADGEQYVSINFENQVGWGAVTNRLLKIDTTPPEPFTVDVQPGTSPNSFPRLFFEAIDATSGIESYVVTIGTDEPFTITPEQAALGYTLSDLEDGNYTVEVVATDLAGNERQVDAAVVVSAGWVRPVEIEEETSLFDYLTGINILVFFLVVSIILLLVYIWYEHKVLRQREEKLRRETREIQDQMEKIFSALRDEIYDQVNHITKRKRLSEKEKEAVEGLTQALEVSETLIEKEISDVKTILK